MTKAKKKLRDLAENLLDLPDWGVPQRDDVKEAVRLLEKAFQQQREEILKEIEREMIKEYKKNWNMARATDDVEVFMENLNDILVILKTSG